MASSAPRTGTRVPERRVAADCLGKTASVRPTTKTPPASRNAAARDLPRSGMILRTLAVFALLTAASLPAQTAQRFAVGSPLGRSGQLCDPLSCTPAPVTALSGQPISLRVRGAPNTLHWLLLSTWQLPCVQIPGVDGALLVGANAVPVAMNLSWVIIHIDTPFGFGSGCGGSQGSQFLSLPPASANTVLYLQTITLNNGTPTLSGAVQLTIQ